MCCSVCCSVPGKRVRETYCVCCNVVRVAMCCSVCCSVPGKRVRETYCVCCTVVRVAMCCSVCCSVCYSVFWEVPGKRDILCVLQCSTCCNVLQCVLHCVLQCLLRSTRETSPWDPVRWRVCCSTWCNVLQCVLQRVEAAPQGSRIAKDMYIYM